MPTATAILSSAASADGRADAQLAVYQTVYSGTPQTPTQRQAATRGVAFVTLRLDSQLRGLAPEIPRYLQFASPMPAPAATGLQDVGCNSEAAPMSYVWPLAFADRSWELRVFARAEDVAPSFSRSAWMFSLIGLLAAALIGASCWS
jgi:hypothetical protein